MSAQERWEAFLSQIEGRHRLVRGEAAQSLGALIGAASGTDTAPISNAWSAVESRLAELERRIIDTWHEKVDDAFSSEEADEATRRAAYERGDELAFALENAREELQQGIFADLARQLFARALATRRERFCTACGSALEVPICARAIELNCSRCGAGQKFEPGELLRAAAAVGAHALPQQAAHAEWLAMRVAERRARAARSPCPLALLKDYERAQIAYWRTYLASRAQLEPELGRDLAMEVRSRMDAWYRSSADQEAEWVRAGRPREPIF